jgi:glutamine synthetase
MSDAEKWAADFRASHPTIEEVDLLLPDLAGVLRGKRSRIDELPSVLSTGAMFPASVFGTDVTGATIESSGLGLSIGDADLPCVGLPDTLVPVTWSDRGRAQVLLSMKEPDGSPFFGDPRTVLSSVLARYAERGWTPVCALELEFYLLEHDREPGAEPLVAVSPVTGRRQTTGQVYGMQELAEFDQVLGDIHDACAAQGVPADAATAEYAAGQYEINLRHVDDALAAADHAVMLKRAIKGVSERHGMAATFMAKPFGEETGSGTHLHVSLLDRDGSNLFAGDDERGSDMLRWAIGGMAATLSDFTAIFAPNANSYRRLQPGAYAPVAATWGYNNRTVAFRVPTSGIAATRFEHRAAGADANPYLVVAAILAGALHGIDRRLDPGEPIVGNAYDDHQPTMPLDWAEALTRFSASEPAAELLGREFRDLYHIVKHRERRRFERRVTPTEWEWYLTSV